MDGVFQFDQESPVAPEGVSGPSELETQIAALSEDDAEARLAETLAAFSKKDKA